MLEPNASADADPLAEGPAGRPPDRPTHQRIEIAAADAMTRVEIDQLSPAVVLAQPIREAHLEIWIPRRRGYSMNGRYQAIHAQVPEATAPLLTARRTPSATV